GNITVTGNENVTVNGAVSQTGVILTSISGDITIPTGMNINLGSTATNGLEAITQQGNITITGPLFVQVKGAVGSDGVGLISRSQLSVGTITLTLDGAANSGMMMQGLTVALNGPINIKILGAVSSIAFATQAGVSIADNAPVTIVLGSNALSAMVFECSN